MSRFANKCPSKKCPWYSPPPSCTLGTPAAFLTPLRLRHEVFEREEEEKEGGRETGRENKGKKQGVSEQGGNEREREAVRRKQGRE